MCLGPIAHERPVPISSPELLQATQTKGGKTHLIVEHHYNDHSNDVAAAEELAPGLTGTFPIKLYDMLDKVDGEGLGHVVSWQPHGRSFIVHKPDEFAVILPRFFKQKKVASFQRQLNLYGFMRLTRGPDRGCYYHERFLRGRPFLTAGISRCKVKGTGVRARSNPEQEPNFWEMPWINASNFMKRISSIVTDEDATAPLPLPTPSSSSMPLQELQDDLMEPLPINSARSDLIISDWGMPFYYLNSSLSKPDNVPSTQPMQIKVAMVSPLLLPHEPQEFLLDDMEFEQAISEMLQDNCEGDDLAHQLELLTS
jgi:hypothetical protein